MKQTVNVNVASEAFTMDQEAYRALDHYYKDIKSRLADGDKREVMEDVESRTADIFREKLTGSKQVVSVSLVGYAISMIGNPSTFGEPLRDPEPDTRRDDEPRRLYRSRKNMIGGVCAGLADYFNVDPSLMRILFVFLVFLGGGGVLIYIILWIVLPLEPSRRMSGRSEYRDQDRR